MAIMSTKNKKLVSFVAGAALLAVPVGLQAQSVNPEADANTVCIGGICDLWLVSGLTALTVVGIIGFRNPKSN